MTTHTHPEIEADILEMSKATASEIGDSEKRLRADIHKIRDDLKSDIVGLQSDMKDLKSDVKAIKDFLLPPKP